MPIELTRNNGLIITNANANLGPQRIESYDQTEDENVLIQKTLDDEIILSTIENTLNSQALQDSVVFNQISTKDAISNKKNIFNKIGFDIEKPDIILINDFKPLANSVNRSYQTMEQNQINLEFDNFDLNFKPIVKIIEMHRVTNDIMINAQQKILEDYSGYKKEELYDLYEFFKMFLKDSSNIQEILNPDIDSTNIDAAVDKLIEIASLSDLSISSAQIPEPEVDNQNLRDASILAPNLELTNPVSVNSSMSAVTQTQENSILPNIVNIIPFFRGGN